MALQIWCKRSVSCMHLLLLHIAIAYKMYGSSCVTYGQMIIWLLPIINPAKASVELLKTKGAWLNSSKEGYLTFFSGKPHVVEHRGCL